MVKSIVAFILIYMVSTTAFAIERRKDQFLREPGYFVFPAPYSLPGLGSGIAFIGTATNVAGSITDVYGLLLTGDVEGRGFGIAEIPLFTEMLILDLTKENIDKASVNFYSKRGMDTEKDDYSVAEISNTNFEAVRLALTFFERRFDLIAFFYNNQYQLDRIRDQNGDILLEITEAEPQKSTTMSGGVMLDLTDDRQDPRVGLRVELNQFDSKSEEEDENSPDYYVEEINVTVYLPIDIHTWVFNYYSADAVVTKEGETDRDKLAVLLGLSCEGMTDAASLAQCEKVRDETLNNTIAANKYGTAGSFGGRSHLRSYPEGRFRGAHLVFYGTEFRYNFMDDPQPFDLFFMKDIRTSVQIALFYETGTLADTKNELGHENRSSAGIGFRMLTGSGLVYRLDYATGDEGGATTIIVNYPWGSL
ncbi:hypothetical protein WDW89_04910 [Deltaproteobacteria bacterium TL4]